MAEGQLKCLGSSLFLKSTYGVGYQLTIEKQPILAKNALSSGIDSGESNGTANETSIDGRMQEIVTGSVEDATLLTNVGTEMSFQLPLAASASFTAMFKQLDELVEKGAIVTYGVGITTLDEVFLLVARGATSEKVALTSSRQVDASVAIKDDDERSSRSKMDLETEGLFVRHVVALFKKRAMNFKRDKKAWCCTTILPSVVVLVGFLMATFITPTRDLSPLTMNFDDYNTEVATEPRNPIVFNSGANYSCQPGRCIYEDPIVAINVTDELYFYCGVQSYIGNATLCSINPYEDTISQITEAGAQPIGLSMSDVNESSYNLASSREAFAATQYGGIFYQHDLASIILEDRNSSSIYDFYFGGNPFGDLDFANIDFENIDLEKLGPLLESYGINISGINISDIANLGLDELDLDPALITELSSLSDVVGLNYSDAVVSTCLQRKGDYFTNADCEASAGLGYLIQYNFTAIHVAVLYQMLADEAIVREAIGNSNFKIQTTINPLPITSVEASVGAADDAFIAWFLIILAFPFIAGSFATFVVEEKQSKAKHLQTVAGVKPVSYWLSTWLWDVANYQIPLWITVILMFAFGIGAMTTTQDGIVGAIISVLILFGPAAASFSYCISFLFSSPSICNLFIIISGFLIGLGGSLAEFILRFIGANPASPNESLILAADIILWVLRFVPSFCLSRGLYVAINLQSLEFLEGRPVTAWDSSACLYDVVFLACESVVYLALAMKIDEWSANPRAVMIWKKFLKVVTCQWHCDSGYRHYRHYDDAHPESPTEDDVAAEEERVLSGRANDDLIVISQLSKIYDNGKKAVNSMSLGIPPGQCFGLLGINGAGKREYFVVSAWCWVSSV